MQYIEGNVITLSVVSASRINIFHLGNYIWKVHNDTCGSDHFPIILENSGPELDDRIPRWNLRRAKWDEFKNSCILNSDTNNTDDDNIT